MKALTLDDLLPLEEFASRRREFFQSHLRYLDRHRRVRLGPRLTLVFENRQTLWFRVQEILRVARISEPAIVQQELDLYNRLLPGPGRLQAALLIAIDEGRLAEELAAFATLRGPDLRFHIGDHALPAELVTSRPEDRTVGAAQWVQFALDDSAQRLLTNRRTSVHFSITVPEYRHDSLPLTDELRQSLLDDLQSSQGGE